MTRKIMFRAWDLYEKKMIYLGDIESISLRKKGGHDDDFANFELMQYTGLKDKNGQEIYEGDVVKTNVGYGIFNAEVKWINEIDLYPMYVCSIKYYPYEIIGNIYENKDLLK